MSPSVSSRHVSSLQSFNLAWNSIFFSPFSLTDTGKANDSHVFVYLEDTQIIMSIRKMDYLFIPTMYLTNFDAETGQINWQERLNDDTSAIGSNSKDIVLISGRQPPRKNLCLPHLSYCEAAQITSYALSGEKNWTSSRENMNGATAFTVGNDIISLKGNATRSSYNEEFSLHTDTGEQVAFQGIQSEPFPKDAYAIAERLGHSNNVISNYEEFEGTVFYLTNDDNTLWAVDKNSEQIIGYIRFDGDKVHQSRGLTITADDNMVAIYFGDSQQFFVFHFTPEK